MCADTVCMRYGSFARHVLQIENKQIYLVKSNVYEMNKRNTRHQHRHQHRLRSKSAHKNKCKNGASGDFAYFAIPSHRRPNGINPLCVVISHSGPEMCCVCRHAAEAELMRIPVADNVTKRLSIFHAHTHARTHIHKSFDLTTWMFGVCTGAKCHQIWNIIRWFDVVSHSHTQARTDT